FDLKDYNPDAFASEQFNGGLYGVPVLSYACLPTYVSFGLLAKSKNPKEAFQLAEFFIQKEQQLDNFEKSGWYSVRLDVLKSIAGKVGFDCPKINALPRATPDEVLVGVKTVQTLSDMLGAVLEGQVLNLSQTVITFQKQDDKRALEVVAAPSSAPLPTDP